jgi:outer membrane protein TolC
MGALIALVIGVSMGSVRPAGAADADTLRLRLSDAIARAMDTGEEMKLAQADYLAAHALYQQARSSALPQLRFGVNYTRQIESVFQNLDSQGGPAWDPDSTASLPDRIRYLEDNTPDAAFSGLAKIFSSTAFASKHSWNASLGLTQKLFEGGSIWSSIAAAKHALRSVENSRKDRADEIVLKVREAYLNALLADRGVEIAGLGLEQAERQLERVRQRKDAGSASEFELLQAEVQRDNQIPVVKQAVSAREIAYLEIYRLVNLPNTRPVALTSGLLDDAAVPQEPAAVDTTGLVAAALGTPGIVALAEAVKAREHAVTVSASGKWPGVSLFANYSEQAYPADLFPKSGQWQKDVNAGVTFSWKIFDGFQTRGVIAQAKAQRDQQYETLQQTRETIREGVIQSSLDLERAAADLRARTRTVELAKRAYELASLRFDEGATDLIEVKDSRASYQIAQMNEASARHDYFVALARLERYTGRPLFSPIASAIDGTR